MSSPAHPDDSNLPDSSDPGPWADWNPPQGRTSRRPRRSPRPRRQPRTRQPRHRDTTAVRSRSRATTTSSAPWRDARIVVGVVLLLVSSVMGMRVVSSGPTPESVWVLERDLPQGTVLAADDLRQESLVRSASVAALTSDVEVVGRTLNTDVHRDHMLTATDIAQTGGGASSTRLISVPVDAMSLPPLRRGDRVDLWSVPAADSPLATATLVLADVAVMSTMSAESVGVSGQVPVVLAIPAEVTSAVLQAVRDGAVAVVQVPIAQIASTPNLTSGVRP